MARYPRPPLVVPRLKELREKAGLSQLELVVELRTISPMAREARLSVINRYESGQTQIPDWLKLTLAQFFGVSVPWLMGWENEDGAA